MKNLGTFLLIFILVGCTTAPLEEALLKVDMGDTKGMVLHKVGSPTRTYSKEGILRWVYLLKDKNTSSLSEKEIWFQNGLVVFIDLKKPKAPNKENQIQYESIP